MSNGLMPLGVMQMELPVSVKQIGEIRTYRMELPFLPPSKNVYDNWPGQWKSSAKNKWKRHVKEKARTLELPQGLSKVGLHARLVFPTKLRRDPQNYAQALWHWVPDALVQAGVLRDDAMGNIAIGENWGVEFAYDSRPNVPKSKRQRTVITIACRIVEDRDELYGSSVLQAL